MQRIQATSGLLKISETILSISKLQIRRFRQKMAMKVVPLICCCLLLVLATGAGASRPPPPTQRFSNVPKPECPVTIFHEIADRCPSLFRLPLVKRFIGGGASADGGSSLPGKVAKINGFLRSPFTQKMAMRQFQKECPQEVFFFCNLCHVTGGACKGAAAATAAATTTAASMTTTTTTTTAPCDVRAKKGDQLSMEYTG